MRGGVVSRDDLRAYAAENNINAPFHPDNTKPRSQTYAQPGKLLSLHSTKRCIEEPEWMKKAKEVRDRRTRVIDDHTASQIRNLNNKTFGIDSKSRPPSMMVGARTDSQAILLEGYLLELGASFPLKLLSFTDASGFINKWRRRWCTIRDDQLFYWKEKPAERTFGRDRPPQGSIQLRGVKAVEPAFLPNKPNVLRIDTDEGSYWFQAENEEKMMLWIAGLLQEICRVQFEVDLAQQSTRRVVVAPPNLDVSSDNDTFLLCSTEKVT
jgi:hypothetical protein